MPDCTTSLLDDCCHLHPSCDAHQFTISISSVSLQAIIICPSLPIFFIFSAIILTLNKLHSCLSISSSSVSLSPSSVLVPDDHHPLHLYLYYPTSGTKLPHFTYIHICRVISYVSRMSSKVRPLFRDLPIIPTILTFCKVQ